MEGFHKRLVQLQHGLPTRDDNEPPLVARPPHALNVRCKIFGARKLASTLAIRSDEVRIAEAALRQGAILFSPRPEVATGEAQEHRAAAGLNALPLERQEAFLDGIGHA
jgi:hypothetical protein